MRLAEQNEINTCSAAEEFDDFSGGGVRDGEATLGVKEGGGKNEEKAAIEGKESSEGECGAFANEDEQVDFGGDDGYEIEGDLGMIVQFFEHLRNEVRMVVLT